VAEGGGLNSHHLQPCTFQQPDTDMPEITIFNSSQVVCSSEFPDRTVGLLLHAHQYSMQAAYNRLNAVLGQWVIDCTKDDFPYILVNVPSVSLTPGTSHEGFFTPAASDGPAYRRTSYVRHWLACHGSRAPVRYGLPGFISLYPQSSNNSLLTMLQSRPSVIDRVCSQRRGICQVIIQTSDERR